MNIDTVQLGLHLFNFVFVLVGFAVILVVVIGIPLIIIYAIYRAAKNLMTYNAELKERERERIGRDL